MAARSPICFSPPASSGQRTSPSPGVEGHPGSEQPVHSHPGSEQVYVIVQGRGAMTVGDETREVGPGPQSWYRPTQVTPYAIPEKNGSSSYPRPRPRSTRRPPTAHSHTPLRRESHWLHVRITTRICRIATDSLHDGLDEGSLPGVVRGRVRCQPGHQVALQVFVLSGLLRISPQKVTE